MRSSKEECWAAVHSWVDEDLDPDWLKEIEEIQVKPIGFAKVDLDKSEQKEPHYEN